ncbi:MAG: XkdW family protein [Chromatiaceae bacterium]|nr:XkdW family protein [Chromatiaceae bacterium]
MYLDSFSIAAILISMLAVLATVLTVRSGHQKTIGEVQRLRDQITMMEQHVALPSHASREMCCAIRHIYPHALHGVDFQLADDGEGPYIKEWLLEHPLPEAGHLEQAIGEYRQMLQESNYHELRRTTYPAVGDQLDALYKARHGNDAQLKVIDEQIARVKERYPKPEICEDACEH